MKIFNNLVLLSLCAGMAACTNDTFDEEGFVGVGGNATLKEITVTLPEIEDESGAETRTQFVMDASGVKAYWAEGDTIGIFPANGDQVSFPINGGVETNVATFDGGDWGLKAGRSYAAYFPYNKWNIFRDNETILLDYTGQVQTGNNNADHLGAYDFLAAGQISPNASGYLNLDMQRLGCIVMLQIQMPEACTPTCIELTSAQNSFVTKATLDISTSAPNVIAVEESSNFTLGLDGVELTADDLTLTAYLMLSPVAFKTGGSTWSVNIYTTERTSYTVMVEPKDLEAGKPYKYEICGSDIILPMLTNTSLITAAESSTGQQFTKNPEGTVTLDEANMEIVLAVTKLDLSYKKDPTICDEIGFFVNLEELDCSNNNLTSLDLSYNTALTTLNCDGNQLTYLDISENINLHFYITDEFPNEYCDDGLRLCNPVIGEQCERPYFKPY